MKKPKMMTLSTSKARRADTYRGARRNLAREIRAEASLRGRSIAWPAAWKVAQKAAYHAEKAAIAYRPVAVKASAEAKSEAPIVLKAGVDIAPADPFPGSPQAAPETPAPKKPRAKKAAAPRPEGDAPKAPKKAVAKAPKADAAPKAAPRKRALKPAA